MFIHFVLQRFSKETFIRSISILWTILKIHLIYLHGIQNLDRTSSKKWTFLKTQQLFRSCEVEILCLLIADSVIHIKINKNANYSRFEKLKSANGNFIEKISFAKTFKSL